MPSPSERTTPVVDPAAELATYAVPNVGSAGLVTTDTPRGLLNRFKTFESTLISRVPPRFAVCESPFADGDTVPPLGIVYPTVSSFVAVIENLSLGDVSENDLAPAVDPSSTIGTPFTVAVSASAG